MGRRSSSVPAFLGGCGGLGKSAVAYGGSLPLPAGSLPRESHCPSDFATTGLPVNRPSEESEVASEMKRRSPAETTTKNQSPRVPGKADPELRCAPLTHQTKRPFPGLPPPRPNRSFNRQVSNHSRRRQPIGAQTACAWSTHAARAGRRVGEEEGLRAAP